MNLNPYHARYYAALLTRRAGSYDAERVLPALLSANIDLHPHQIDAALFAVRSQFRDGVILADEEGLGKTIEAGIALLQAHIEDRQRLLVLCPPSLQNHWRDTLRDMFSLDVIALRDVDRAEGVVLLSYVEAARDAEALASIRWDLCVLDEAHLLANAGLSDHIQSDAIRGALAGCPKLLLTATPMQNSLLDLYYLIRFVDETAFGSDPELFRARYMDNKPLKQELAARVQMICQRTLKRQALTMQLPKRIVRTLLVAPTPEEDALSKRMSLYFHRPRLAAFPKVQEHRIRMTYWKMLASCTATLHESLEKVVRRLEMMQDTEDECADLREVADMAAAIHETARSRAFLTAFKDAMRHLREAGMPQKAVIFSEYRRTLSFLRELLKRNGFAGQVAEYTGGDAGCAALDTFAGKAKILLATDSAGTGLNLSHCALVVNYDMPYNVQKLEQRISRFHRYGQKHDVHVLNFLDPTNRADKRMYTLLNRKLKAFDDVFGASETVLGHVADAQENAIPDVRAKEEIEADIAQFERENKEDIERRVQKAESDLLAHFDEDVRERFRKYGEPVRASLSHMEHWLWEITRYKLRGRAAIDDAARCVIVDRPPYKGLRLSRLSFGMDKSLPRNERYHLNHPLAKRVLQDCLDGPLTRGELFLRAGDGYHAGMSGEIGLWRFHHLSKTDYQALPLLCGFIDGGGDLTSEDCAQLMRLAPVDAKGMPIWIDEDGTPLSPMPEVKGRLAEQLAQEIGALSARLAVEQDELLQEELNKLRRWAEDEAAALSLRREAGARELKRLEEEAEAASNFNERFRLKQELAMLTKQRRNEDERMFYQGAEIQQKRDELMRQARGKASARVWEELLFVAKWQIVE